MVSAFILSAIGQEPRMKRFGKYDRAKESKKQKLLKEIEDRKLPYLTPKDVQFEQLSKAKYPKLYIRRASCVPQEIHQKVQQGLTTLQDCKCFAQDLVQIKEKDVLTPVYRLLVGDPGTTYCYLNTRLFTIPWPSRGVEVKYSSDEIGKACKAIKDLNEYLHVEAMKVLLDDCSADVEEIGFVAKAATSTLVKDSGSMKDGTYQSKQSNTSAVLKDRTSFNVTLLNYMDPSRMKYLKEEPYFGMGKMAVSWHHDENLVERSTVAVYNYSCDDLVPAADESNTTSIKGRDPAVWHVGLKIAWDIATPGLAFPLDPGDCYFMLDDLNMTHQHCVLSGMQPRFSSTHRVAECSSGTLDYIFQRCDVTMKNLQKDPMLGIPSLISLELDSVKQTEEIHNEVEFEWLRQFWFQGKRSAKVSDWWFEPMALLEKSWREMEQMTKLLLCEINEAEWSSERKHQVIRCLLPYLEERQELRKSWMARCQSRLARSLPVDEQPECRPHWYNGDSHMPLPFDLEEIISLLSSQLLSEDGDVRS
ncbi:alpha-ketoglutarate-dependent dioxygenase FTO isoform X1 [Scyliorhinus canicula]|uniref:alpha-ketoglutarate-dependent dioxygenase FTO isoform X1 n=1 Tax=Scyliorhinus canicula TaxID=7830 RepID=UPI0018F55576|nr:alpha-ketoglutarate-dependent dioxygenase FTO isoform X1 [Scyliorhinus canicula]